MDGFTLVALFTLAHLFVMWETNLTVNRMKEREAIWTRVLYRIMVLIIVIIQLDCSVFGDNNIIEISQLRHKSGIAEVLRMGNGCKATIVILWTNRLKSLSRV